MGNFTPLPYDRLTYRPRRGIILSMSEDLQPPGQNFRIPLKRPLETMALTENVDILLRAHTSFQQVTIVRLPGFGKCLFLDGDIQSSEYDQKQYHSALINPAFKYNPNIKTALILGGGEGATAKTILNHPQVEKVTMVDIDEELVKICAQLLPEWCGKVNDTRLTAIYQDAGIFVPQDRNRYDLIVWDLVDPHRWYTKEPTTASGLYTPGFFNLIKDHLTENGILSIEYAHRNKGEMSNLLKDWRKIARRHMLIPSFDEKWIFALMSRK